MFSITRSKNVKFLNKIIRLKNYNFKKKNQIDIKINREILFIIILY